MITNPNELFDLFYKNVTFDMNPPGFPKWQCDVMQFFWHERFMNAYLGIREPLGLRSWAEVPQMWLAGYRENKKGHNV